MIKPTHTVFFIGLLLLYNALRADVKMLAFDLINSALIYAALIVSNILWGFFREVQGDWKILTICILLALFLVIYMLYSYLKDISELLKQKTR